MRVIAIIAAAVLLVAGCSSEDSPPASAPSPTSTTTPAPTPTPDRVTLETTCRTALRADYEAGWDSQGDQWPPSARQPVCSSLDRPTIQRLMDEAIADIMSGTTGPS